MGERENGESSAAKPAPTGCYKCGQTGHWSSDCPSAGSSRPESAIRRTRPESAPPTGCFKCGRPGHWSRDCPSSGSVQSPPNASGKTDFLPIKKPIQTTKKLPRERPKLTPQLLASDEGIGYILRHFPRSFKPKGRGHEVEDLGKLIGLYTQWHSRLLPYFSFDQFVQKVENVGTSKRMKMTLRELRERVDKGEDPTKLYDPPVPRDVEGDTGVEGDNGSEDPPIKDAGVDEMHEDMFDEIYQQTVENNEGVPSVGGTQDNHVATVEKLDVVVEHESSNERTQKQLTEEQKARMEANRLKALAKAASRSSSLPCP